MGHARRIPLPLDRILYTGFGLLVAAEAVCRIGRVPYIPPELKPLFEQFGAGPKLLHEVIEGVGPSEMNRPGPEGWSVRDVIVHLSDTELVRAVRIRQMLAEDEPSFFTYDEGQWKRKLHYLWRSPEAALSLFQQTRFSTGELLRQCDRQSWERTATHPGRGVLTLADMLRIGVEHVDDHVEQVRTLRTNPAR